MNAQPIDELLNRDRLTDLAQSAVSDAHDLWPRIEGSVRDLQREKAGFGAMRRNIAIELPQSRPIRAGNFKVHYWVPHGLPPSELRISLGHNVLL